MRAVVEREFPDLWADLSGEGRDMFVRGLIEAASRPPDDRDEAVAEVIETWHQAHILLYAPVDDEPYTDEERAEDDAALERLGRGEVYLSMTCSHGVGGTADLSTMAGRYPGRRLQATQASFKG